MDWQNHRQYCTPHTDPRIDTNVGASAGRQQVSPTSPYSPMGSGASNPAMSPDVATRNPNMPEGGQPFSVSNALAVQARGPTAPTNAGTTTEFDAVLFPWNEERPRIIRVQCLAQPQASGPTIWTPLPQEPLGGVQDVTSMIITNGIGGAPLRFPLHLFYGTNSFGDGSPTNRTIQRMTGGKATYPWAGKSLSLASPRARLRRSAEVAAHPQRNLLTCRACR